MPDRLYSLATWAEDRALQGHAEVNGGRAYQRGHTQTLQGPGVVTEI